MSSGKAPWWRAFDRIERAVGRPLEEAAQSKAYVDVMVTGLRVQRAILGTAAKAVGGAMGTVLKLANVPTRGDVRRLSRQMATLTGEVRALAAQQEQHAFQRPEAPADLEAARARRVPATGSDDSDHAD